MKNLRSRNLKDGEQVEVDGIVTKVSVNSSKSKTKEFIMQPRQDGDVELVFQKSCACKKESPEYVFFNPSQVCESGTPICSECGDDYEYKFVQVKRSKR